MNTLTLSPRLSMIANLLRPCKAFADIGTDHGYLPLDLLSSGKIQQAFLCDVNEGPLDNAKSTFLGSQFESQVTYRLGSGLSVLKVGEASSAVIAGMGGQLVLRLIQESLDVFNNLDQIILQPMTEQETLRSWLRSKNYNFTDYFIEDASKQYEIIFIDPKHDDLFKENSIFMVNEDLEFGYAIDLEYKEDYEGFLNFKTLKYDRILTSLLSIKDPNPSQMDRLHFARTKYDAINRIKERIGGIE